MFCQGKVYAEGVESSFVFCDVLHVELGAMDSIFTKGIMVQARRQMNVSEMDQSKVLQWFHFYSEKQYAFTLGYNKGEITVSTINKDSSFAKNGLKVGDRIINVNGIEKFETKCDMLLALHPAGQPRELSVRVLRAGNTLDLKIKP